MADPFEVRMRFTTLLTHLSASTNSSMKTAAYALKHRDMDEDLHSCIIENLERGVSAQQVSSNSNNNTGGGGSGSAAGGGAGGGSGSNSNTNNNNNNTGASSSTIATNAASMNIRANIMYFLEHFCEMAIREDHQPYVEFVRRDIGKIVDCVAASGANVKVVRKVVGELATKGVLEDKVVQGIEEDLKAKEKERGALLGDENGVNEEMEDSKMRDVGGGGAGAEGQDIDSGKRSTADNRSVPRSGRDGRANGVSKADKRAIEQRIEEDRERNKRLREGVWAVNGDDMYELEKMWEEGSDLNEDDYIIAGEEADERRQFARYHQTLLER